MLFPVIVVLILVKHRFGSNPVFPEYIFNKYLFFRGDKPFPVPDAIIRTPAEMIIDRTFNDSCVPISQVVI